MRCANCFLDFEFHPPLGDFRCSNCGTPTADKSRVDEGARVVPIPGPGAALSLIAGFFATLRALLFNPVKYFSDNAVALCSDSGLSSAIAFALIVQWLATFFNFLWRSLIFTALQNRFEDLLHVAGDVFMNSDGLFQNFTSIRDSTLEFVFGAGSILLTPFSTLIKLVLVAALVHAAVRFFFKEDSLRRHSYGTTMKILSYASAPWILCVIPGFGLLLAWTMSFYLSVIGLREVYRSTTTRAVTAVLFPEILFCAVLLMFLFFIVVLGFNLIQMFF